MIIEGCDNNVAPLDFFMSTRPDLDGTQHRAPDNLRLRPKAATAQVGRFSADDAMCDLLVRLRRKFSSPNLGELSQRD